MKGIICTLLVLAALPAAAGSPCRGVTAPVPAKEWPIWATAIAKQLHVKRVDPLRYFEAGGWRIIMVRTHESDDGFLFYSGDPSASRYIMIWGGAALPEEESEIRKWAVENAPGIPTKLAKCFAFHVTREPYP